MESQKYVIITSIDQNSEAERVGLQKGDIIFEYNNNKINGDKSFFVSLTPKTEKMEHVELKIIRENEVIPLTVKGGRLGLSLEVKSSLDNENVEDAKYPALRVISGIYKFLAIIIGVGSIIALIIGLSKLDSGYGASLIVSALIAGTIGVITSLAISEIIKLFIDLEDSSRKQLDLLNKILDKK